MISFTAFVLNNFHHEGLEGTHEGTQKAKM